MTTRILIEQSEGLTIEWQVIDGDAETLFVDYSELVARAADDDIDYVRDIREQARAWDLDRVVTEIDRITTEEGWKLV
jgi:hypothetical protein